MGGDPETLGIYTDADESSTFDPSWTFSDSSVMTVDWGDGSAIEVHATGLSHTYAAGSGRHRVVFTCPDRSKLTGFDVNADLCRLTLPAITSGLVNLYVQNNQFSGDLPSFAAAGTALRIVSIFGNQFTGSVPSFAVNTGMTQLTAYDNRFTGEMPSFATCTALQILHLGGQTSYDGMSGTLPSFNACTELTQFVVYVNQFSGTLPTFAACTKLTLFSIHSNLFSGTLPSFNACNLITTFRVYNNLFSGTLPDFSGATALTEFRADNNDFSGYTPGSFATQKFLATLNLKHNELPAAAVDNILADLVTSLGISGRVTCTVTLDGAGMEAPSAAGLANKATLEAAGWTVTVQTHVKLADLPITLEQMGFETLGTKLYAVAGRTDGSHSAKTYEYDPAGDTWTEKADLPLATGMQSGILKAVGTKLYHIGGYNSTLDTYYGNVYEYDPAGNTWTAKTAKPTPVEDFGAAVYDGKIYCFGGLKSVGGTPTPITTLEIYDPVANTWDESKADMPLALWSGDFGCEFGGKIYAFGSARVFTGYPNLTPVNIIYEYDPVGDSWATYTTNTLPKCYKEVVALGTKMYIGTGSTSSNTTYSNTLHSYIPSTDTFAAEAVPPYPTGGAGLAVYDGNIYMLGGIGYGRLGTGDTQIRYPYLYRLIL